MNVKRGTIPFDFRQLAIAGRWGALLTGLLLIIIPQLSRAELDFHVPPGHISWQELKPERETSLAPVLDLNGDWTYQVREKTGTVMVPSCFSGYEGVVTFRRSIDVPGEWQGKDIVLRFLGVRHRATLYFNGIKIGSWQCCGLPFEVPVPDKAVNFGAVNELVVEVDNRPARHDELPLQSSVFAPRNYGGITREVFLQALPQERINSLRIYGLNIAGDPGAAGELIEADLRLVCSLLVRSERAASQLSIEVFGPDGRRVSRRVISGLDPAWDESGGVHADLKISQARTWTAHDPYLYRVTLTLSRGDEVLDRISRSVGVRSAFSAGGDNRDFAAYLNLERIQGVAYAAQWPQGGKAVSKRQLEADVEMVRDLGANVVRCAFYPPHPYFLDLCDSLGLPLLVEIPLFGVSTSLLQRDDVQDAVLAAMEALLEVAARHPSIAALGWGSGLDPEVVKEDGSIGKLCERTSGGLPFYAQILGEGSDAGAVFILNPSCGGDRYEGAIIPEISLFTPESTDGDRDLQQAQQLNLRLSRLSSERRGFFVSYLNDWYRDRPVLTHPPAWEAFRYRSGLCDVFRQPRIAYFELHNFLRRGEIGAQPIMAGSVKEPPWEFLAVGIVLSASFSG